MKKPSKAVQKYLKYLRLESIIESHKDSIKAWDKKTKKLMKHTDIMFDVSMTSLDMNDIRMQFCITVSGYVNEANEIVAEMRKSKASLNNERKKLNQMTYEELRNDGIDRLYADDARKYIKEYMKKIETLISSLNHLELGLINDTLAYVSLSPVSIKEIMKGTHEYRALIGLDPITREVSVSWYVDGHDIIDSISTKLPMRKDTTHDEIMKVLSTAVSNFNEINDKMTEQMHDTSVTRLINATEKHTKEISRLSKAVEKLETSEPEKVHYEKPVVGKSPEEVIEKKSFSVTSEN